MQTAEEPRSSSHGRGRGQALIALGSQERPRRIAGGDTRTTDARQRRSLPCAALPPSTIRSPRCLRRQGSGYQGCGDGLVHLTHNVFPPDEGNLGTCILTTCGHIANRGASFPPLPRRRLTPPWTPKRPSPTTVASCHNLLAVDEAKPKVLFPISGIST